MNSQVELKFRTYNKGRQVQKDVLGTMTRMMKSGDCHAPKQPLVVAVSRAQIKLESLAQGEGGLGGVEFTPGTKATVEVLAGLHRVEAARSASVYLRVRLTKLQKQLDRYGTEGSSDSEGERASGDGLGFAELAEREVGLTKDIIESIETWPVKFYDIGTFQPHSTLL